MEDETIEPNRVEPGSFNRAVHNEHIRVWPVVRQSLRVLFRNFVPFVLLACVVGWSVGMVLFLTGLAPFLVLWKLKYSILSFSDLYYRQIASVVFHAFSRVAVEGVIAMAVWRELGGRRLTLKDSLVTAARAIPGIQHRPFYLFVSRVSGVAILRGLLYLPQHMGIILVMTSELEPESGKMWMIVLSAAGFLLNAFIDTRLLMLVPVAAIERTGVFDSFRRCWQLTSRHWTQVLGVLLLVGCFVGALDYSSSSLLKSVAGYLKEHNLTTLVAVGVLLTKGPTRAYWAVVATVCYSEIRVANGDVTPEQTAVPPSS